MTTPDEQWWEAQAGEYVLGTLRGAEREVFEKILTADEDVQIKVERWQQRLSDLDALTPAIEPPAHLLPAILARISPRQWDNTMPDDLDSSAAAELQDSVAADQQTNAQASPSHPAPPEDLAVHRRRSRSSRRSNTLWKSVAGLATAACVAMAVFVLQIANRDAQPSAPTLQTVSIVQNEQNEALWLLTTESGSKQLKVLALSAPPAEADKSYQLWMVKPDNAGVSSVGLLTQTEGESQALTLPITTDQALVFAVSLEPAGGSPEAGPTGPVLFQGTIINL